MLNLTVTGAQLAQSEIDDYIRHIGEKYPNRKLDTLEIHVDGDYVDLKYEFVPANFDRIRRITGYLVGTVDQFNNAKRAEVKDRVKHVKMN